MVMYISLSLQICCLLLRRTCLDLIRYKWQGEDLGWTLAYILKVYSYFTAEQFAV